MVNRLESGAEDVWEMNGKHVKMDRTLQSRCKLARVTAGLAVRL